MSWYISQCEADITKMEKKYCVSETNKLTNYHWLFFNPFHPVSLYNTSLHWNKLSLLSLPRGAISTFTWMRCLGKCKRDPNTPQWKEYVDLPNTELNNEIIEKY